MLIKNFDALNKTPERKMCLELIEAALSSIQPIEIINSNFSIENDILTIQKKEIPPGQFQRVFLLGFGKGSAGLSYLIEEKIENFLTAGYVIDVAGAEFKKIEFTLGTHPLPSQENISFTKKIIQQLSNLTIKDLVIVVITGGGSALLEDPYSINLETLITINKALLHSGATITEMNVVRKHLSKIKGGGLTKLLYPASVITTILSDVPGNDLSAISSGPTVKDLSTKQQALEILGKYNLSQTLSLKEDDFLETPKEDQYFENVSNILLGSNQTALSAMEKKALELGLKPIVYSSAFESEAKIAGIKLIQQTPPRCILLAGGETTVRVSNATGLGGRNQEVILGALLENFPPDVTIASFDSDGWDNSPFAGAIGDYLTVQKAKELNINPETFLQENNSFSFFEKTGDGIITGRLPSNVSDLMIVIRK